jgi:hypothetical protein
MMSSADDSAVSGIEEIERLIVPFDAGFTKEDLVSARRRISELEAKPVEDRDYRARLAAWSGRLFLLEGSRSEAAKALAASREALPGNIPAAVLASRLERDAAKRLDLIAETLRLEASSGGHTAAADGSGELLIERARTFLEQGLYREAAAAFDMAFARLAEVYERTYRPDRDNAWDMRGVAPGSGKTSEIAQLAVLTWRDAIELTKNETGLLTFLTAGRNRPAEEIFSQLAGREFIPARQSVSLTQMSGAATPDDALTRAGAAWYLWRLVAENLSDKSLLERYSSRYRPVRNPQSPIADVPVWSVFFDAILGCVEWEIMSLPDGAAFSPAASVRGTAFLAMLAKAEAEAAVR